MVLTARNCHRTRRDPKNLDGGLAGSRVIDAELAVVISSKGSNGSVRQNDGGEIISTRHSHGTRRYTPYLDWCISLCSVVHTESTVGVVSKSFDRPVRQENGGLNPSTRNRRHPRNSRDRHGNNTIRRIPEPELTFCVASKSSHSPIRQKDGRVKTSPRNRRKLIHGRDTRRKRKDVRGRGIDVLNVRRRRENQRIP
jgi:hypothetical protein